MRKLFGFALISLFLTACGERSERVLEIGADMTAGKYEEWCDDRSPEFRATLRNNINNQTVRWNLPDICQPKSAPE